MQYKFAVIFGTLKDCKQTLHVGGGAVHRTSELLQLSILVNFKRFDVFDPYDRYSDSIMLRIGPKYSTNNITAVQHPKIEIQGTKNYKPVLLEMFPWTLMYHSF